MQVNQNIAKIQYSLIRVLNEEAKKYDNSINLTIGEPDLSTEKGIVEDACQYAMTHKLSYPPTGGGVELRGIIADYYNKKYGCSYVADNVVMNIGASEAISSCFKTLLNIGDEVIIFKPYYPGYLPMITMTYAKPVFVDTSKTNFTITPELLAEHITDKTKVILICNPSNPSGNVMSREEIEKIVDYVADKDIFILADEIYNELSFVDFTSFASFPKIKDKLIIVNGFSKSHSMTGWRVGYTIFPLEYRKLFVNATLFTLGSPVAVSLAAAESAITKYSDRSHVRKIYQERAEYLYKRLIDLGFEVVKPKGAFYLFVKYTMFSDLDSFEFTMDVLKEVQVALVPGISFGNEGYFRISLIADIPTLGETADRLKKYLDNHKK